VSGFRHWLRGGFPDSLQAASDARSLRWRQDFIRTYLGRYVPQFGPRIAPQTLRRFWTRLAHLQDRPLNGARLARHLGVDAKTVNNYIDLLCDLLLVRRLPPWHANVGKHLTKSPKVYVRDSGLVDALLDIPHGDALLSHPVVGASWQGFVVENLLACAPEPVQAFFLKRGASPKVKRGFHSACEDLKPVRKSVGYPGIEEYPLGNDIRAIGLPALCLKLEENAWRRNLAALVRRASSTSRRLGPAMFPAGLRRRTRALRYAARPG
jgi:predicted AAA+ superfamily ATPase